MSSKLFLKLFTVVSRHSAVSCHFTFSLPRFSIRLSRLCASFSLSRHFSAKSDMSLRLASSWKNPVCRASGKRFKRLDIASRILTILKRNLVSSPIIFKLIRSFNSSFSICLRKALFSCSSARYSSLV